MSLKPGKFVRGVLALLLIGLILIALGLIPINLAFLKQPLENFARENLDLDVALQGAMTIHLGPNSRLEINSVELRKSGPTNDRLVRVEDLIIRPRLRAILAGDMHIKSIEADNIQLDYCAALPVPAAQQDQSDTSDIPSIAAESLKITNTRLFCGHEQKSDLPIVEIVELGGSADVAMSISLVAQGEIGDLPIHVEAEGGTLADLLAGADNFPLQMGLSSEDASFSLDGFVAGLFSSPVLQAEIDLSVPELQSLLAKLGIDTPFVPNLDVSGQSVVSLELAALDDITGRIGTSGFAGDVLAQWSGDRVYVEGNVEVDQFDMADFGNQSPASATSDNQDEINLQILFSYLQELDGRLRFSVGEMVVGKMRFQDLTVESSLEEGFLDLSRLHMRSTGSSIDVKAQLDTRPDCATWNVVGKIDDVDLIQLQAALEEAIPMDGAVENVTFEATSCGNSIIEVRNAIQASMSVSDVALRHPLQDHSARIDSLTASAGWSGSGQVSLRGEYRGEGLSFDARGDTLQKLVEGSSWPVSAKLLVAGASVTVDGEIAIGNDEGFGDLSLQLNAPRIGALHRVIDVNPDSDSQLSAGASVAWSKGAIQIDDVGMVLGQSTINGRLETINENGQPVLVANFRSPNMDIQELSNVFLPGSGHDQSTYQPDDAGSNDEEQRPLLGFVLPSVDLHLSIENVDGAKFEVRDIDMRGGIRDQFIDDANLSLLVDDVLFEGVLDVDLRQTLGTIAYQASARDLDIGRLLQDLEVAQDMNISADLLSVEYATQGRNVQGFLENGEARVEIRNFSWLVESNDNVNDLELRVDRLEMASAPDLRTEWSADGHLNGFPLEVWGDTPSLASIFHGQNKSSLTLVAGTDNSVVMLSGDIDWSDPVMFLGELVLSGQKFGPETVELSQLESPLKGISVSTDLAIGDNKISTTDLRASLGSSLATGNAEIRDTASGTEVEVRLRASHVQTTDLFGLAKALRDDSGQVAVDADDPEVETDAGIGTVIREFIEAQTLEKSFDFQIGIDEVYAGEQFMGGAEIGLFADRDNFRLQPVKFSLPSGDIDVEYVVEKEGEGFASNLNMYIEQLQYGDLIHLADPTAPPDMRGLIYLDAALTATAPTVPQLIGVTEGNVNLMIVPEDIEAGVVDLWAANLVVALIAPQDVSQPKKLNCMVADFLVEEGVMKSKTVLLDSTDVIVRGKGEIDLGNRTIDMFAAPQAKLEKLFSMSTPIAINGPWNNLQIGVAPAGFIGTTFRLYYSLLYVPYKWITGERFPADGLETCYSVTDWEIPVELLQ